MRSYAQASALRLAVLRDRPFPVERFFAGGVLTDHESPVIWGRFGTAPRTRSNADRFPRPARSSKYSTVNRADIFSATAVAMNWLIEMSSR